MVAVIDGYPYTRVRAGRKRDCRSGAAYLAWKDIIHTQQEQVGYTLTPYKHQPELCQLWCTFTLHKLVLYKNLILSVNLFFFNCVLNLTQHTFLFSILSYLMV